MLRSVLLQLHIYYMEIQTRNKLLMIGIPKFPRKARVFYFSEKPVGAIPTKLKIELYPAVEFSHDMKRSTRDRTCS